MLSFVNDKTTLIGKCSRKTNTYVTKMLATIVDMIHWILEEGSQLFGICLAFWLNAQLSLYVVAR